MRGSIAALFVFTAHGEAVNPVQKVLQILADIETKIIKEGEEAQKVYDEFTNWCDDRSGGLAFDIKTGSADAKELTAAIEKATADLSALNSKIEEIADSVANDEVDLKAATGIREKELKDFSKEETELQDIVSALERAIAVLEREAKKGGASMAQLQNAGSLASALQVMVDASMISSQDEQKLTALVQSAAKADDDDDDDYTLIGAPTAEAYEKRSGSITDLLQELLDKARGQLDAARQKEAAANHNFEMLKQSLTEEIKNGGEELDKAKKGLASVSEEKATAEGDLLVTSKTLAEDKGAKESVKQDCMAKAEEFEQSVKSRSEELKALNVAKEAVKGKAGGAAEATYSYEQDAFFLQLGSNSPRSRLQVAKRSAFLQGSTDLANFEVVHFVRNLAKQQHDPALAQLARTMASVVGRDGVEGADPFEKIRALITDMIAKLEKEGEAAASHKEYCDKEMSATKQKETSTTTEEEKLLTKIDVMTSKSAQLKEEVAGLQKALFALTKTQSELDAIRQDEKAQFDVDSKEMQLGLDGVKIALRVLREYYAKSGEASHETSSAGGGVVGMLEVVESDFTKQFAEMTADENAAVQTYEKETEVNAVEKATKEKDVVYKAKEHVSLDKGLAETKRDLAGVSEELSAIMEYGEKLKKMCVAEPEAYGERRNRRQAEIDGLREALSILASETALLQSSKGGRSHGSGHRFFLRRFRRSSHVAK